MVPNGLVIELKAIKKAPWDSQMVDCGHFEPLKKVRFTVIKTNDLPAFYVFTGLTMFVTKPTQKFRSKSKKTRFSVDLNVISLP